jgi:hypothetical protein
MPQHQARVILTWPSTTDCSCSRQVSFAFDRGQSSCGATDVAGGNPLSFDQ